jgi:hypothetical protein
MGAVTLARFPIVIFWLVPVSMVAFVYAPVLHYEALVLLLAFVMALEALHRFSSNRLTRPHPLVARYGLFLLTLLPALPHVGSMWRFGSALKIYVVGFVAFLVARRAAARWGRSVLLWGPVTFIGLTTVMLTERAATLGIPTVRAVDERSYLSTLPWGSSNYVAAVTVLCLPVFVHLIRVGGRRMRLAAVAIMGSSLVAMFLTTSRGGFLLSTLYLATLAIRTRRARLTVTLLAGVLVVGMVMTPLGQGLIGRFSDQRGADSIVFRIWIWSEAWNRGVAAFPFGVGAGQGVVRNDMLGAADPHSFMLHLFGESGVLSVLAWLLVFATLWRMAGRLRTSEAARSAGMVMRDTLALALINSMFEPTLVGNLYHLLFWWLMGIYVADEGWVRPAPAEVRRAAPAPAGAAIPPTAR